MDEEELSLLTQKYHARKNDLCEKWTCPEKFQHVEERRNSDERHPSEFDEQVIRIAWKLHSRWTSSFESVVFDEIIVDFILFSIQLMYPFIATIGILWDFRDGNTSIHTDKNIDDQLHLTG